MFNYIKGIVTDIGNNYIVIENNDIGYTIYVSNPYSYNINETYKVYLYNVIREDENSLYGFKSVPEKEMFLSLISVKGLGPKMAMPILATGSVEGIVDAIERENILYLKKFPKIGDKVARQIILDLKGKLVSNEKTVNTNNELVDVLISLGYKSTDIKRILPNVDISRTLEEQIKEALKLLLK